MRTLLESPSSATTPSRVAALPRVSLALALLAGVVALWGAWVPDLGARLEWQPAAFAAGEPWRWVSGHLAHFSWEQTWLNIGALLLLGAAVERLAPRRTAWVLGLTALAVPAALGPWAPDLPSYRGLSGLASGAFALLVVLLIRRAVVVGRRDVALLAVALGAGFAVKLGWELTTGRTAFADGSADGYVVVPLAHAVAAAIGALVGLAGPAPVSGPGKPQDLHTDRVTGSSKPQ